MIPPNPPHRRVGGRHALLVTAALVAVLAGVCMPVVTSAGTPVSKAATDTDHYGLTDKFEVNWADTAHSIPSSNDSDGCHTSPRGVAIHPCVSGDSARTVSITIFGDSHALAWLPALERLAPSRHWRIVAITKSACPSIDVTFEEPVFTGALPSCLTWRARAVKWIRSHPQDLVILANSRGYRLTDKHRVRIPKADRELAWKHATARTLQKLPTGRKVLVLGDVPVPKANVPVCLRQHPDSIAACERSRHSSTNNDYDDAERAAAVANGASFGSMSRVVCSYDPCPVVVDGLLLCRTTAT